MRSSRRVQSEKRRQPALFWKLSSVELWETTLSCFCSCLSPLPFNCCWSPRIGLFFFFPPLESLIVFLFPLFILCEIISKSVISILTLSWVSKIYLICILEFLREFLFIFPNAAYLKYYSSFPSGFTLVISKGEWYYHIPVLSPLKRWSFFTLSHPHVSH